MTAEPDPGDALPRRPRVARQMMERRPAIGLRFDRAATRAVVIALFTTAAIAPPIVLAHDDPPAHYLETDLLYPAFGDRPTQSVELELIGLLQAAEAAGYPIRVALVANETDVENAEMVERPQAYAELIVAGIELELGSPVDSPVLVVAPSGFGVAGRVARDGARDPITAVGAHELLSGIEPPAGGDGDHLARAAMAAVRRIADSGGHPLPASVPPAGAVFQPSGGEPADLVLDPTPFVLFALIFVPAWLAFEVVNRRRGRRGTGRPGVSRP